jgi:hypothetical protein
VTFHDHRHIHLATGQYWWHTHDEPNCDGTDFNTLHHHPPSDHAQLPEILMRTDFDGNWRIEGTHRHNLHDQGWRSD